jgi:ABC-type branched-subunit amino acid transport system permease subunit
MLQERIAKESETQPYRWGYFQGAVLIPWSLLLISDPVWDLQQPSHYPWYLMTIALLMGLLGLPLAYGLLRKRAFALTLVYSMFGLTLLLAAVRLPTVMRHFDYYSQKWNASFDAGLLLMWLFSIVYYRRRKAQFR